MNKLWHDTVWEDYTGWQAEDKKTLRKINALIKDIERNGYNCIGKPEPLRGNLSGWWSVRIDDKNRLIFMLNGGILEIYACKHHYND
jgi:toxin YoeB